MAHKPRITRTIKLPDPDISISVELTIDINGYPIVFIQTDGIPIVDNEVEALVYINNGTDPDNRRYTPLREVGR